MNEYPYSLRSARVRAAMTIGLLLMPGHVFASFLAEILRAFQLPPEVEGQRIDGWCCIGRGHGRYASTAEPPCNLRDETGRVLGEVAMFQARGDDLWALVLWRVEGEDDETWAARVRGAFNTGRPTKVLADGVIGVEAAS